MALTVAEKIAQVMEALIKDDSHGYTQGAGRYGDSSILNLKFSDGTRYQISGGDRDCSGAVRTCVGKALGKPMPQTFWTGNEGEVLRSLGFKRYRCSEMKVKRGDVLLRVAGHTEVVIYSAQESGLGYPICGGFRINEKGTILGGRKGDQTGSEATSSRYYPARWDYIYRYEKDQHKASRPAPKKPSAKPRPAKTARVAKGSAWAVIWDKLNVRTRPNLSAHCTGSLQKGYVLYLDGKTAKDSRGVTWAEYITSAGNRRWVSMRGLKKA